MIENIVQPLPEIVLKANRSEHRKFAEVLQEVMNTKEIVMRKMFLAAMLTCSSAVYAQATNPESSGQPATAQQSPSVSGADQSMPQGAATVQNATSSGKSGLATNGNGRSGTSKTRHHHHGMAASGSTSAPTTGAPE